MNTQVVYKRSKQQALLNTFFIKFNYLLQLQIACFIGLVLPQTEEENRKKTEGES